MVEVGTGASKTRFIMTRWPITKGLIAGTTSQTGNTENLVPEKSVVPETEKV